MAAFDICSLKKTQLASHFTTPLDLGNICPLEWALVRIKVFELDEAEVAEVGDGEARRLGGDDDLHQLHRLRPQ